jgi:hypothetical protein
VRDDVEEEDKDAAPQEVTEDTVAKYRFEHKR